MESKGNYNISNIISFGRRIFNTIVEYSSNPEIKRGNAKIKTEGLQRFNNKVNQVTRPNTLSLKLVHEFIKKSLYPHLNTKTASAGRRLQSTTTALISSESWQPKK